MVDTATVTGESCKRLLTRLESFKDLHSGNVKDDMTDVAFPAKDLVEHASETRKRQNLLCSQMRIMDFFLTLLENMEGGTCKEEAISQPEMREKINEVKQKWKGYKMKYLEEIETIQSKVPLLLEKLQQLKVRQQTLSDTLGRYEAKKQEVEEKIREQEKRHQEDRERLQLQWEKKEKSLDKAIKEVQARIQQCKDHIGQLQQELQTWTSSFETLSKQANRQAELHCLMKTLQGIKIKNLTDDEMFLEVTPQALIPASEITPLELCVRWNEGELSLSQVGSGIFNLDTIVQKPLIDLKNALLEIQHSYISQAELVSEIQRLHDRYAIDWLQEERKLRYLKTSSAVYVLSIEPGYPANGQIQLLGLQGSDGIEQSTVKPQQENPSLSDWLECLHACPEL